MCIYKYLELFPLLMCRISELLSKGMLPHSLFRLPPQNISAKSLKKLLQKSPDL